ncbi:hypothetical protein [Rhizomonospora bruguierae]|uniref:hypothetical protein n=1 Tax=Rhizomonospora bruguierae TaxID=1581705 RepID=UPI001BD141FF|nr:hypothetical protein [Micromonospora sp. NBRC 107566]
MLVDRECGIKQTTGKPTQSVASSTVSSLPGWLPPSGGTTADGEQAAVARAERELSELLAGLPGRHYGDVAIRLFQTVLDGVLFGLVDETDDEFGESVELYPDELGFVPPWDGEYDT